MKNQKVSIYSRTGILLESYDVSSFYIVYSGHTHSFVDGDGKERIYSGLPFVYERERADHDGFRYSRNRPIKRITLLSDNNDPIFILDDVDHYAEYAYGIVIAIKGDKIYEIFGPVVIDR